MKRRVKLGVNIDHVATLRQARGEGIPDLLAAAFICQTAGADGITVHLREDRRHIQDQDVILLQKKLKVPLNLEMANTEEMVSIACRIRPEKVCLVPEKRQELTTEGGLNVLAHEASLKKNIQRLNAKGISVSIFLDPAIRQVEAAKRVGASVIEIHTGSYARAKGSNKIKQLRKIQEIARYAQNINLIVNAGHGLDCSNVNAIAKIPNMNELNIGFSIIARSIFVGLRQSVMEMKRLL